MQRLEMEVRGRHLATGLPVNLVVNSVGAWFEKTVSELNNAKEIKVLCAGVSDVGQCHCH